MTDLAQLSGKVAVITGGTRGIGRGIARALLELGASVIITGRNGQGAATVATELSVDSKPCEGVECDVTNLASVAALAQHVREKYASTFWSIMPELAGPVPCCMS